MSDYDLWDDSGAFHYRFLPESSLDAFFTEERDMLTISHDLGKWWIGETSVAGQSAYDTLAEAKAAGDAQIAELEAAQDGEMLKEAGLDPAQWRVSYHEGIQFDRIDGTASIVADDRGSGQRWDAFTTGDDPIATRMGSVAAALTALDAVAVLQPD